MKPFGKWSELETAYTFSMHFDLLNTNLAHEKNFVSIAKKKIKSNSPIKEFLRHQIRFQQVKMHMKSTV